MLVAIGSGVVVGPVVQSLSECQKQNDLHAMAIDVIIAKQCSSQGPGTLQWTSLT